MFQNGKVSLLQEYTTRSRAGHLQRLPLFVYGTLLQGFGNHHLLTRANCRFLGIAEVRNFSLFGMGIPFARFTSPDKVVKGELYSLPEGQKALEFALEDLDSLEGEGVLYCRLRVSALLVGGEERWAWMYVDLDDHNYADSEPYQDYRQFHQPYRKVTSVRRIP